MQDLSMTSEDTILLKQKLAEINIEIARMEDLRAEATAYFQHLLSDQFILRRASGKVIGKSGPEDFLEGLKSSPIKSRAVEDISVNILDGCGLVTLIIAGTLEKDNSVHRYRNIRMFSRSGENWILEFWYNYDITGL
jgi:hypothetical protein